MKRKLSFLVLVLAFVFGIGGSMLLTKPSQNVQADQLIEYDSEIKFTAEADKNQIIFSNSQAVAAGEEVVVTYTVTYNDGINSLILIPQYDADVFTLTNVSVKNDTVLGEAAITNDYLNNVEILKILFENAGENTFYNTTDDVMLTLTFETNADLTAEDNGEYEFGLVTNYYETQEDKSVAYKILDGENLGDQKEVKIVVEKANVTVVIQEQGTIAIQNDAIIYNGLPASVQIQNANDEEITTSFTYTKTGDGEVTYKFYADENCTEELLNVPTLPGEYYLKVTLADGLYYTGASDVKLVTINKKQIEVAIENKTSDYGDAIVALTHSYTGDTLCGEDTVAELNIVLSTTAEQGSNAGEYPITGSYTSNKYNVVFQNGTYTITPKAVTITAIDQTASYANGNKPTVDQTKYTVSDNIVLSGVEIKIEDAEVYNVGEYVLIPSYTNSNYTVTAVNGKFYITSVGKDIEFIKSFFEGKTLPYNAQYQDLLTVKDTNADNEARPDWINISTYYPENALQINAGDYLINIRFSLDQQSVYNYLSNETIASITEWSESTNSQNEHIYVADFYFTVDGKITPHAIEIAANNHGHVYGETPETLTPATVAGLEEDVIEVSFTVKDGGDTITLAADTNVGQYAIVPSATNANYTFSYVNGTYTITKATPVITVNAENVYYNRELVNNHSVAINTLSLSNYTVVIKDANGNAVDTNSVLDAGTYTIEITVAETSNYNAASSSAEFVIKPVKLANAAVTYNHGTAEWTVVTQDAGAENVEPKALYNTTLTYKVNGATNTTFAYTANATDELTLVISSSNENYLPATVVLNSVYAVSFDGGNHPANSNAPANMPNAQYIFEGQTAVEPSKIPTLDGYTFKAWDFNFATQIGANTTVVALWDTNTLTMTVVYIDNVNHTEKSATFTAEYGSEIAISTWNLKYQTGLTGDNDDMATEYDLAGMHYVFGDLWSYKVTGETEYIETEVHQVPVNALASYTFVAVYTATPIEYVLTYMISQNDGEYTQYQVVENMAFGSEISYINLSNVAWFRTDAWYADADRITVAPATMPASNLTVYGALVFNIGQGDVNGDGHVNSNDITLYRQWIVGGYEMTVVANGQEWATANSEEYNAETRYFLARVADNNIDASRDIRDISITRMAIVGGYTWDIRTGLNVTGEQISRNDRVTTLSGLIESLNDGNQITILSDINDLEGVINVNTNKDVYIDLNGKTITVKSFFVAASGNATITVKNGTIKTTDGITITAPQGNVVLENLIGYVGDSTVNLQAASSSLHIKENVAFYGNVVNETPEPAVVNVEKGTHLVIEENANIVAEKLVVTDNFVPTIDADATITMKNNSAVAEVVVEGNVVDENTINSLNELKNAGLNGGTYTLAADITFSGVANRVRVNKDTVLNLNGYTITSTNEIPLVANNGATLTINGNGNVNGREACVMAFSGSNVVINGGTYTCTDNFVLGTNGSTGMGGNTFTINAGTFNGGIQTAGYVACGIYVANNDTVTVNAGTFNITNGVGMAIRAGKVTVEDGVEFNFTDNGRSAGWVGDKKTNLPAGKAFVLDLAAEYPGLDISTFEFVNNTDYDAVVLVKNETQLKKAKAFADTIVICNDMTNVDEITFTRDIVLDLNGHNVTFKKWGFEVVNNATLTINGNGIVSSVEATLVAQNRGHLVVNGGTYYATDNFVVGTQGSAGNGGNSITINAGTFNGGITSAGYVACGIYVANSDTVVVNGGTFNITNGVGILARSGNTTVGANVVFNVIGDGTLGKVGDSRVVLPAGAVLVWDKLANYPGGAPTLTNNSNYDVVTISNDIKNINNLADLEAFRDEVNAGNNFAGKTIKLNADITLNGAWEPISNYSRKDSANESKWFAGTFDGNGHTISGLTNANLVAGNITEKEEYTYGLFGSVNNAVIKNLTLTNVSISASNGDSLGALVGYYANGTQKAEANISNITVSGNIAGSDNVGGVVGRATGAYFKALNVTVSGTVTADYKASGIVGTGNAQEMVFENCVNNADVSSTVANSNQGYNTVAGISITWNGDPNSIVCRKVVMTNCANHGEISTVNANSIAGALCVDYSPKTDMNANGTWTYASGHWTHSN